MGFNNCDYDPIEAQIISSLDIRNLFSLSLEMTLVVH